MDFVAFFNGVTKNTTVTAGRLFQILLGVSVSV
jgi:hypothetical protein